MVMDLIILKKTKSDWKPISWLRRKLININFRKGPFSWTVFIIGDITRWRILFIEGCKIHLYENICIYYLTEIRLIGLYIHLTETLYVYLSVCLWGGAGGGLVADSSRLTLISMDLSPTQKSNLGLLYYY